MTTYTITLILCTDGEIHHNWTDWAPLEMHGRRTTYSERHCTECGLSEFDQDIQTEFDYSE